MHNQHNVGFKNIYNIRFPGNQPAEEPKSGQFTPNLDFQMQYPFHSFSFSIFSFM